MLWIALALWAQPAPPPPPAGAGERPPRSSAETSEEVDRQATTRQARAAANRGDLATAESTLRSALSTEPDWAGGWAQLGAVLLRADRHAEAATALQRALERNPELGEAEYNLAYAQRAKGDLVAAAETYGAYLQDHADDADAWYAYAEVLEGLGRSAEAAEAFDRYADTEGRPNRQKWVDAARERAASLRGEENAPPEAPSAPQSGEAPESPPPDAARGSSPAPGRRSGPLAAALEALQAGAYRKALGILRKDLPDPQTGWELAAWGSAHLGVGEAERAERRFSAALERLPDSAKPAAQFGLAEALRLLGRSREAKALYQAVREGPSERFAALAAKQL